VFLFKDVFCFGSQTGEEINDSELEEIKDPWIYFTCFVNQ
jgi:hypothetical protein